MSIDAQFLCRRALNDTKTAQIQGEASHPARSTAQAQEGSAPLRALRARQQAQAARPMNTLPRTKERLGYATILKGKFKERYEVAQEAFERLNLGGELTIIRTTLGTLLEKIDSEAPPVEAVVSLIREIRQLVTTIADMQDKYRGMMSVGELKVFLAQLREIIERNVKDETIVRAIEVECQHIALPATGAELEKFGRAVAEGRVPSPDA